MTSWLVFFTHLTPWKKKYFSTILFQFYILYNIARVPASFFQLFLQLFLLLLLLLKKIDCKTLNVSAAKAKLVITQIKKTCHSQLLHMLSNVNSIDSNMLSLAVPCF